MLVSLQQQVSTLTAVVLDQRSNAPGIVTATGTQAGKQEQQQQQHPKSAPKKLPDLGSIFNMQQFWQAYDKGVNGEPAFKDLEATQGTAWRPGEKNQKAWYEWKTVVMEIRERAAAHTVARSRLVSEDEVVSEMEAERKAANLSVAGIARLIRDKRAAKNRERKQAE